MVTRFFHLRTDGQLKELSFEEYKATCHAYRNAKGKVFAIVHGSDISFFRHRGRGPYDLFSFGLGGGRFKAFLRLVAIIEEAD